MKKEIHPKYHNINLVWVDGTTTQTRSTWGKEGDTIRLDIDPTNHPAWTGKTQLTRGNQLDKFNKRFSGIGSAAATKSQDDAAPSSKTADGKK